MPVIPQPAKVKRGNKTFVLNADTAIQADPAQEKLAEQLASWLRPATGYPLSVTALGEEENVIRLERIADTGLGPEGYRLEVSAARIVLQASSEAGLFYAAQTLRQLLPFEIFSDAPVQDVDWTVPGINIEDHPRFVWRGAMLDVVRHFMPLPFIKQFIDLLALHKLNTFHWHLTDDQGWRLELKRHPRLTEVGAWRKETLVGHALDAPKRYDGTPHGGFYTQDEVREVVAYAAERFITVVPEIEMPGHATAALAAYPELGTSGKPYEVERGWGIFDAVFSLEETTFRFLEEVLEEVLDLFPSPFIHIGGDEVPKEAWTASEAARARLEALGLTPDTAQSYFIGRIDAFLSSRGRRLIGWDEILEGGLAPGATVMSWRGEAGGIAAAKQGHDVVMTPTSHTYLDYYQAETREPLAIGGHLPLEQVYAYDPIPSQLSRDEAKHVLGTQAQLWTEYMPTLEQVQYMAFPRLCALSEVAWSEPEEKDFGDFRERLKGQLERFDHLGITYRKPDSRRTGS